jgi:hypothetical protein
VAEDAARLDGNAIGGLLDEVFGGDLTAVPCTCGNCGRHGVVAEILVYLRGPGVVGRCSACNNVLLRITHVRAVACVEMLGFRELATAAAR